MQILQPHLHPILCYIPHPDPTPIFSPQYRDLSHNYRVYWFGKKWHMVIHALLVIRTSELYRLVQTLAVINYRFISLVANQSAIPTPVVHYVYD